MTHIDGGGVVAIRINEVDQSVAHVAFDDGGVAGFAGRVGKPLIVDGALGGNAAAEVIVLAVLHAVGVGLDLSLSLFSGLLGGFHSGLILCVGGSNGLAIHLGGFSLTVKDAEVILYGSVSSLVLLVVGIQLIFGVVGQLVKILEIVSVGQEVIFQAGAVLADGHRIAVDHLEIRGAGQVGAVIGQVGVQSVVNVLDQIVDLCLQLIRQAIVGFGGSVQQNALTAQGGHGGVKEILVISLVQILLVQTQHIDGILIDDLLLGGGGGGVGVVADQTVLVIDLCVAHDGVAVVVKSNLRTVDLFIVDGGNGGIALEYAGIPNQQQGN